MFKSVIEFKILLDFEMSSLCAVLLLLLVPNVGTSSASNATFCYQWNKYNNISTVCESEDLACANIEDVIRIESIQYQNCTEKGDCKDCGTFDTTSTSLKTRVPMFEARLYDHCSQQNNCSYREDVYTDYNGDDFIWIAYVQYECISTDTFRNICSSWNETLEGGSLNVALDPVVTTPLNCSCIIEGEDVTFVIKVVDYRPYVDELACADSIVYIDGEERFICSNYHGVDASEYNTPVNVSNSIVNITISSTSKPPKSFWFNVEGVGSIHCNEMYSPRPTTIQTSTYTQTDSTYTSQLISTTFLSSTSTSKTSFTQSTTSPTNKAESESSVLVPAVSGGVAGAILFIVAVAITVFCIHKRRKEKDASDNCGEDTYDSVVFERSKKSNRVGGVSNCSYPLATITKTNTSNKNAAEDRTTIVDANMAETYSDVADMVDDQYSVEHFVREYEEPIQRNSTVMNVTDNDCLYAKPIKERNEHGAYSTLAGVDTYSHTPEFIRKVNITKDNYSHVTVKHNQTFNVNSAISGDLYSRITPETCHESNSTKHHLQDTINGDDDDDDEYDHLGRL